MLHTMPAVLACLLAATPAAGANYQLENAFPYLSFVSPTDIVAPADGSNRLFVVEKTGAIWTFPSDYTTPAQGKTLFLDVSLKIRTSGEAGLLGLAFHPDFKTNGWFYIYYVTDYPYRNILARYHVSADPNVADPASELILLDVPKLNYFHNGGQIRFGTDGYLYIGMGDDLNGNNAQRLTDMTGKILRIDVNNPSGGLNYGIPPSNPFAGNPNGYLEEIYAYGFRNPWRFSLDDATGEFWVADVGEDTYEELDLVTKGRNYGWPLMEGPACFQPSTCDTAGLNLALPLYWYDHTEGVAIIGGQRYRGKHVPELAGTFVFADYTGGEVWGLNYDGAGTPERSDLVLGAPPLLTFGEGPLPRRELYVGSNDGHIYRLARIVTGVEAHTPPSSGHLLDNIPNPFNPATTIRYELPAAGHVVLEIVSASGAIVRRIDAGTRARGVHGTAWNGTTDAGTRVASGVYFCRLTVDGVAVDARRLVLVE
jgi:glucose/arabinose dehydrogenase